ncbi:hypothetical protein CTI12_AA611020 [Artemisia annua]|uniref:Cupin type-1 domain-containing protein n=1 Tax=Artemisia annua TaxID=35608 RepID=A0A2U1KES5_ARTAN|nr:hypothetical protein CTI12_AA611020 [Artemisia annua]
MTVVRVQDVMGLVHFQFNSDAQDAALALSAFGSANAGIVSVPNSVFNTAIDDQLLTLSFKTDVTTIQKIPSSTGYELERF